MLRLAEKIDRAIGALLRPALVAGVTAMIVVITAQIVTRVFFTALGWTEEVSRFLLIWLTFLGAAVAWHEGRHIAVTVLVERLPERLRQAVTVAALLFALAFLLALAWIGYQYMSVQSFQKSPALRLPMSYVYAIIPISALLMAWLSLTDLLRALLAGETRDGGESQP